MTLSIKSTTSNLMMMNRTSLSMTMKETALSIKRGKTKRKSKQIKRQTKNSMKLQKLKKRNINCQELMMKTNLFQMKPRKTWWMALKMMETVLIITRLILIKLMNMVQMLLIKNPNLTLNLNLKVRLIKILMQKLRQTQKQKLKMQTKRLPNKNSPTPKMMTMLLIWKDKLEAKKMVKRRISTKKRLMSQRQSYPTCKMSLT